MKVLVTGASGFLATNTIIELLSQGYKVVGLLRDKRKYLLPSHSNLELIEGDLFNINLLDQLVQKCDCIIHTAAETSQSLINYSDYYTANITSTGNLLQAAQKFKLKKFVFVSSANTLGYGTIENPGTEVRFIKEPFSESFYARSKLTAQELVLSKANEINVAVVNPTFMLGPYDKKPGSGRIIRMNYGKKIIFYPPGGKNFVHVTDVAKGIVSVLKEGKSGELYLLANENLTYKEFFQKLISVSGSRAFIIKVPKSLLLFIGIIGNVLRFAGFRNEFTLTNMKILCINNFYSNKKAITTLNIEFHSIDSALLEAISWFKDNKMIK